MVNSTGNQNNDFNMIRMCIVVRFIMMNGFITKNCKFFVVLTMSIMVHNHGNGNNNGNQNPWGL